MAAQNAVPFDQRAQPVALALENYQVFLTSLMQQTEQSNRFVLEITLVEPRSCHEHMVKHVHDNNQIERTRGSLKELLNRLSEYMQAVFEPQPLP